jgi:hypothetical protein
MDLRYFSIIYDVIDQVKQVASGLLGVEIREEIIGIAEVRDVFRSSKFGAVAGCMVIEGTVKRNKPIRVLRDNTVIFEGELESLRRFKELVEEVRNGTECGIASRPTTTSSRATRSNASSASKCSARCKARPIGHAVAQVLQSHRPRSRPSCAAIWANWCMGQCGNTGCRRSACPTWR